MASSSSECFTPCQASVAYSHISAARCRYTIDNVLQDVDGKQLMCECLYLYGTMLLLLEHKIPGPVREKMVVAVYRHQVRLMAYTAWLAGHGT